MNVKIALEANRKSHDRNAESIFNQKNSQASPAQLKSTVSRKQDEGPERQTLLT